MPQRPIILFDVMDTLVVEPFFTAIPQFMGMTFEELCETKHPTSWVEFEEGRITEAEYVERFFKDGRPVDRRGLRSCVQAAYRWVPGMRPLLEELHSAGYEMHALSNYSSWYELIEQKLHLSRYLDWSFVSCLTGVRKPDRRAYRVAIEQLAVSPGECLFIDDRQVNVQAADGVGLDTLFKQDAAQVRRELTRRRLL